MFQNWQNILGYHDCNYELYDHSRFTNLYYFIPRFSGVGIIFFYQCLSVRTRVYFHGIGRECLNRISWNLVALQHICCFYYVPAVFWRKSVECFKIDRIYLVTTIAIMNSMTIAFTINFYAEVFLSYCMETISWWTEGKIECPCCLKAGT
jgi:hypothetical protein